MQRFILFFLIFYAQSGLALDPQFSLKLGDADLLLVSIEKSLRDKSSQSLDRLKVYHSDSINIEELANECITSNEFSINKSANDLDLLGPQTVPEDSDITDKRVSLNKNMLSSAQQLASCRLMMLRVKETIETSASMQQSMLEDRLFTQQLTILDHVEFNLSNPLVLIADSKNFLLTGLGTQILIKNGYPLLFILMISLVLAYVTKKWIKRHLVKIQFHEQKTLSGKIKLSFMACTNHYLPVLLSINAFTVYLLAFNEGDRHPFITILFIGFSFLTIMTWLIRLFLSPCDPAQALLDIDDDISASLTKRLRVLAWLLLTGFLLYFAVNSYAFNQYSAGLIRNVYMAFLVLNLIWITFILGQLNVLANTAFIRLLLMMSLVGAALSDWFGYSNLSIFILVGLSGSVLLLLISLFISHLFSDFIDGFDEGRYQWQKNARKMIGVKTDQFIPGVIWLRLSVNALIWSFCVLIILKVWGLSDSSLLELQSWITDGFTIGSIKIIPTRILIALLSFSIMISFIGWIKRRLDKSWLKRSRMDRGSKEAMISLTGYFGMAIAFLITLSIAGVQLANLALVAGALSVGIGFGLQNIVNNFVSGVILLFERPIKTGDWISVGGTEGYVRKISIRSTQIQTFDRSDVLVPNSELISEQVTNWMLKDSRGRLIVPVGVAYGTDAAKVKAILLGIAEEHDQVIKNSPILSNPFVLFRTFGDSSLNFELRCFLINVDSRLGVLSDINFEINRLFLEHEIEIPFPQRDLNIKNLDVFNPKSIKQ